MGRNTKLNGLNNLVEGSKNFESVTGSVDDIPDKGGSANVGSLANINVNTQARYVIEGLCESDDDSCGDLKMKWTLKPSCCVPGPPSEAFEEDYGPIDRCTTFRAEPFDEEYFNNELDLENHKACTDYSKYGTNEEDDKCVKKKLEKKDFKRTEASGKEAYEEYVVMRGAADTGIICTDFTLDPDPIKACTWQQAALDAFVSDQAERTQIVAAEAEVSLIAASDSFDPSNREVKPDGCAVKIPSNHRECFIQQNSAMEFGQLYEKKIRKLQQAPRRHRPLTHTALFTLTAPLPPFQAPPSAAPSAAAGSPATPFRRVTPPGPATVHADGLDRADPGHAGAHHRVRLRPLPVRAGL